MVFRSARRRGRPGSPGERQP